MKLISQFRENRLRYLKWILILSLLILAAVWVMHNRDNKPGEIRKSVKKENPMVLSKPLMTEYENEKLKMRLVAKSAEVFESKKKTKLHHLTAHLFEDDGKTLSAWIVADFGEFEDKSDLLHLWGKVRIDLKDGQKLFTNELFFNRRTEIVYNKVKVKALSGEDVINAESMEYEIKKGILLLGKPEASIFIRDDHS